jgi:DNA polymerase elongation subunit (family B)
LKDSYLFLKIQRPAKTYIHPLTRDIVRPSYISVSTVAELDDFDFQPDWQFYSESVVKKAEPIYRAMGWDMTRITRDRNQTTLDGWFT